MEDTLRYFYSAVFQGFAALIGLGAMSYIYFTQKVYLREKNRQTVQGIMLDSPSYDEVCQEEDIESEMKKGIPKLLKQSILIMVISLIALFMVGYLPALDIILTLVGIVVIILIIRFFLHLQKLIVLTFDIRKTNKKKAK